jgi:regulatory protein
VTASTESADAPSANQLRAYAYRLLGRREYSVFELRQRLLQKWGDDSDLEVLVEDLLEALVDENLLSDERFVESFARSRVARCQGPLKIRAALRQKGVDDRLVAAELDARSGTWGDLAAEWLGRQHAGPVDFDTRKKLYRRLANRGFTHDQAMDAIDRVGKRRDPR